jgi:hypothetical protein
MFSTIYKSTTFPVTHHLERRMKFPKDPEYFKHALKSRRGIILVYSEDVLDNDFLFDRANCKLYW